jgi:bifunctional NMN adenylyltransferase/nudix hydrolase
MAHDFKWAVFLGRFNPIHLGHLSIIDDALDQADRLVILLGSDNAARNIKNPWTSEERKQMILSALTPATRERIVFAPIRDQLYNDTLWLADALHKISEATNDAEDKDICLVGFKSDPSSWYLDLFPQWKYISCPTDYDFHAKDIREQYFCLDAGYKKCVHPEVSKYMEAFKDTEHFARLKEEFGFIADYKEIWRGSPYPVSFICADAVVIKSGHILLVRRRGNPGKGLLALPGGFVGQNETIREAAIRELKEETSIALSKDVLRKAITDEKVFDAPSRSLRGRTITQASLFNLGSGPLDRVKGNDDADKAFWLPLNSALSREEEFFEDHYHILSFFVSRF